MIQTTIKLDIENTWSELLSQEFQKDYFKNIESVLMEERAKYQVYPNAENVFAAFNYCPVPRTKVVIIGQDPYHGPSQAHGLSFSVPEGVALPPSLKNIYKELANDIPGFSFSSGNLTCWAEQGVLMLNSVLTVREDQPGSHRHLGWELFTDAVIKSISENSNGVVFLLWGKYAQEKEKLIDITKHHILKAAHPSPFSAHSGFFGCKHFSKTNQILERSGKTPINWNQA